MYNNKRREHEDKILATVMSVGLIAFLLLTNMLMYCIQ